MPSEKTVHVRQWLKHGKHRNRVLLILLIIVALFVTARLVDIDQYLRLVRRWVWQFGSWGTTVYVVLCTGATLMFFPGSPFTILASFLFGSVKGFFTMVAATTVSATPGFLAARYIARDALEERIMKIEGFKRVKTMVEENYWFAIPFVRLVPFFPFSFNNYALGLTRTSFRKYFLMSQFVFIPMNALMVFGANTLYSALTGGEISWWMAGGSLVGVTHY
ncbi:MAG TPA: VTT domain-containing protein [Desulfobacteria bacterium]|nr:VTT domain-containing protein [Desulfobacteria bacterium]